MNKKEIERKIDLLKRREKLILRASIVIVFVLVLLALLTILAIYYTQTGYSIVQKLPLSLPTLCNVVSVIVVSLIILIIVIHISFRRKIENLKMAMKPKPIIYKGKKLYTFTYPEGARGGIFSKTIIEIDDSTAVNVRCQVIKPEDLWR